MDIGAREALNMLKSTPTSMMFFTGINYWAVLVCGIVSLIIGSLWYSPALFGKVWMKEIGMSKEKMDQAKQKGMAGSYVGMFIGALVMALVLAHLIIWTGAITVGAAIGVGIVIWLGFNVVGALGDTIFGGRSWAYYFINIGFYLLQVVIFAAILGAWH
jgi:hypothetical protein